MKQYKISAYETVHATFTIEAKSLKDAYKKAEELLQDEGMPEYARVFDREYEASMAEEIK
jgi:hypothetical protein